MVYRKNNYLSVEFATLTPVKIWLLRNVAHKICICILFLYIYDYSYSFLCLNV